MVPPMSSPARGNRSSSLPQAPGRAPIPPASAAQRHVTSKQGAGGAGGIYCHDCQRETCALEVFDAFFGWIEICSICECDNITCLHLRTVEHPRIKATRSQPAEGGAFCNGCQEYVDE